MLTHKRGHEGDGEWWGSGGRFDLFTACVSSIDLTSCNARYASDDCLCHGDVLFFCFVRLMCLNLVCRVDRLSFLLFFSFVDRAIKARRPTVGISLQMTTNKEKQEGKGEKRKKKIYSYRGKYNQHITTIECLTKPKSK